MKIQMESLLNGKTIEVNFDEQIVFSHLAQDESAVWSLLVAGGYLKVEDVDVMNYCMNKITLATFSYFDVGREDAGNQEPERFYHGFVLGLIADQTDIYEIRSNRESGFGRYDVMMVPKEREKTKIPAIILEFIIKNNKKEQTLEENSTVSISADQKKIMMPNCWHGEYQKRRSDIMDLHLKEKMC